ncbi:MAG: cyclic nucleotide-binding domain-containing protein [Myxococcota bacterium]
MDLSGFLKASPLLSGFSDDGVKIVQSAATLRSVRAGSPIFVEQMQGESLFLIAEGGIELYLSRGGVDRVLATLEAPEHFGELSLVRPGPRQVSARATVDTRLVEIGRRDFLSLQKQRPQACMKLMLNVMERFVERSSVVTPVMHRLAELA